MDGRRATGDALIAFYEGAGTDHAGRRIDAVLAFDDRRLEGVHDYIQWLFPLPEASRFNPEAPVLTAAAAAAFRGRPDLQDRVRAVLDRMLAFYGLRREGETILGDGMADGVPAHWLTPGNHNHLRLSRIVRFLVHAGMDGLAAALRDRLVALADAMPGRVSVETRRHWRALPPSGGRLGHQFE
ncbi:MAG: opioid growth factor receptor-related protein [Alphaproteobacteria bacterium]